MRKIVPIGLVFFIITTGCTGPGGFFGDDEPKATPFEFDLTLDDLWNDIPLNQTQFKLPVESEIVSWKNFLFLLNTKKNFPFLQCTESKVLKVNRSDQICRKIR